MKKRTSTILATLLVLSGLTNGAWARTFSDVTSSHWAYQQIQSLGNDNVVVGYPDGSFSPDTAATRAEFCTMVIKALRQENSQLADTFAFTDVSASDWAYNTIQRAYAFNLIKGFQDGSFRPNDNISKAESVAIIISAVKTGDMTLAQAKEALKGYSDLASIPESLLIPMAQAEKLKMTAHAPENSKMFEPDKKATRAELAVNLFNMRKQALINPNDRLAQAMKPKKAEGVIIENATVKDIYGTIPAGTLLPVQLVTALNSQKTSEGEVFVVKVNKNLVTKEKFLLISQGSNISGEVVQIKKARYFIRNAKMALDTKTICTTTGQTAPFAGTINTKQKLRGGIYAVVRFIFKGSKIVLPEGKDLYLRIINPIKVDLTNSTILK